MTPIKVGVHGALGRMGQEILAGLARDPDLDIVGAVARRASANSIPLPGTARSIPLAQDVTGLLQRCQPQVIVDFTVPEAALKAAQEAADGNVSLVIGTTGLSSEQIDEIDGLCRNHRVGAVIAPNFSLGAVLLMHLARVSAPFFDYAEILEMHHEKKLDAPSGTSLATAQGMVEARGKPFQYPLTQKEMLAGTRGGQFQGIAIHSLRLPGLLAHQEVILGGLGQTLSLRHDTIGRECYIPGVALAVKYVVKVPKLTYGLEAIMGLKEGK